MKGYIIAFFIVMAAIIIVGIIGIKFFLWSNWPLFVIAVLCGIGMWLGDEIWTRQKAKKNKKNN